MSSQPAAQREWSETAQVLGQFVTRFKGDPVGYAIAVHGMEPDENQRAIMEAVARGERLVTIRSGHGVGKTRMLSLLVSWFCNTRAPWKVVITAPTSGQLWDSAWVEICARFAELNPILKSMYEVKAERIELIADPNNCFITARASRKDNPEALQGIHSPNVLVLVDEASGVPDEVFKAGYGSMSEDGACAILTGNPTRRSGFFYDTHTDPAFRDLWSRFVINGELSRFQKPDFRAEIIAMYGRDSNEYRVRVLGEFPKSEDDVLIDRDLVVECFTREIERPVQRPVWAIDPARYGRDSTVFTPRWGNWFGKQEVWPKEDTMKTAGRIRDRWNRCVSLNEKPAEIMIDVIGVGAGVCDRLREFEDMKGAIRMVNVTETSPGVSRGYRLRDHLWLAAFDWLLAKKGHIEHDDDLANELSSPRYEFQSDGRYIIESKEKMQKRGIRSPNRADSFCLTFAGSQAVLAGNKRYSGSVKSRVRVV